MPVNSKSTEEITFVIEPGSGKNKIINDLEKSGLIKNAFLTKVLVKTSYSKGFLAGTYKLSKSMPLTTILDNISTGKGVEKNEIAITFIEGKRFTDYVDQLNKNLGFDKDEIIKILKTYTK